jgi:hypothetical protein
VWGVWGVCKCVCGWVRVWMSVGVGVGVRALRRSRCDFCGSGCWITWVAVDTMCRAYVSEGVSGALHVSE